MKHAFLVVVLLFALPLRAQQLRIYHIDVEQASSTLLVAPGGKTLLVDSGKNGQGSRIKAVMDRASVSRIDFFVATHYHEDHYGGIDDLVMMGVPVLEAFDRGDKLFLPSTKLDDDSYIDYVNALGEDATHLKAGMVIPLDPLMTVKCISSGGLVIGEGGPSTASDENDMSVSLLIAFGQFRYFVGGDIEAPTEQKIANADLAKDVDVYIADHHGSNTSSIAAFLQDLAPSVIVVSNGNNGTYHHPRQSVLTAYTQLGGPPAVFQTNKCLKGLPCGNVADAFIGDPQTTDQDGTITITVNAATSTYTVAFDPGTTRTFPFKHANPVLSGMVITSLLPNPTGDDAQREEVTLKNTGTTFVSLAGWTLNDRSNLAWQLSGSIAAGQSRTFRRNGMAMTLNNNGDELRLLDPANTEQDRFTYSSSAEGMRITTGH